MSELFICEDVCAVRLSPETCGLLVANQIKFEGILAVKERFSVSPLQSAALNEPVKEGTGLTVTVIFWGVPGQFPEFGVTVYTKVSGLFEPETMTSRMVEVFWVAILSPVVFTLSAADHEYVAAISLPKANRRESPLQMLAVLGLVI